MQYVAQNKGSGNALPFRRAILKLGFPTPHRLEGVTVAPRPGWYPDPAGAPGLYRWWDGSSWAEVTSDSAQAPPPLPVETERPGGGASLAAPHRCVSPL